MKIDERLIRSLERRDIHRMTNIQVRINNFQNDRLAELAATLEGISKKHKCVQYEIMF